MPVSNYDDIINLTHHVSKHHPQMSLRDRAAQFAPFAALVGYDDAITETARFTYTKRELDENERELLDMRLRFLAANVNERPNVVIVHFIPDEHKAGGSYVTTAARLFSISTVAKTLCLDDGTTIQIDDIIAIDSPLFNNTQSTV